MRFQVPQFIEHEAKVIGPFTFRQFIYLGAPGAVAFFLYFVAPFFVFVVAAAFLGAFGITFAFIKVGGRSLPTILLNFFNFTIAPKRYIWRKGAQGASSRLAGTPRSGARERQAVVSHPPKREIKLTQKSKIKELATRVETNK